MAEMMRLKPEDILKRHDIALRKKEDFRDLYDEAYEFALPQRNLYDGYYDGKVGGQNYFKQQALDNPNAYMALIGKIIPAEVKNCSPLPK